MDEQMKAFETSSQGLKDADLQSRMNPHNNSSEDLGVIHLPQNKNQRLTRAVTTTHELPKVNNTDFFINPPDDNGPNTLHNRYTKLKKLKISRSKSYSVSAVKDAEFLAALNISRRTDSRFDPYNDLAGDSTAVHFDDDDNYKEDNENNIEEDVQIAGQLSPTIDNCKSISNLDLNKPIPLERVIDESPPSTLEKMKVPILPSQSLRTIANIMQDDKDDTFPATITTNNNDSAVTPTNTTTNNQIHILSNNNNNKESAPLLGQSQSVFNETLISTASPSQLSRHPTVIRKKIDLALNTCSPFIKSSDLNLVEGGLPMLNASTNNKDYVLNEISPNSTPNFSTNSSEKKISIDEVDRPGPILPSPLLEIPPKGENTLKVNDESPAKNSEVDALIPAAKPLSSSILYPLKYQSSLNQQNSIFREVTTANNNEDPLSDDDASMKAQSSITPSTELLVSPIRLDLLTNNSGLKRKSKIIFIVLGIMICLLIGCLIPSIFFSIKGSSLAFKNYFQSLDPTKKDELLRSLSSEYDQNNTLFSMSTQSVTSSSDLSRPTHSSSYKNRINNISKLEGSKLSGFNSFENLSPKYRTDATIENLMNVATNGTAFYGLAYSPRNAMEPHCGLVKQDIVYDLVTLSTVTTRIRTYGMQCNQADYILEAIQDLNLNMTLAMGIWIGSNDTINQQQLSQMEYVLEKYHTKYFESIFIGNEVLFREDKTVDQLIKYIEDTKKILSKLNKSSIKIGTSEIGSLINNKLLDNCDIIGANVHPFFGGGDVQKATEWTYDFLKYQVESNYKSKDSNPNQAKIVITEVGWPYDGGQFLSAKANHRSFQIFLNDYICEAYKQDYGWYYFEAFDEPWKKIFYEENNRWETEWGIFTKDRKLKPGISFPICN